jgi:glycine cleavage system transcriptional repressor
VPELAVTAVGADRPGIVAAVTRVLHERGGNLEDSAMTILGGHFAIVLLVDTADEPAALHGALEEATRHLGLNVSVTEATGSRSAVEPSHLLSVYGADHPGIVAGITEVVAEVGANVTDLETHLIGEPESPVYAMVMELQVPDPDALAARVEEVAASLGVDHTLRVIETETY